MAHFEGTIPEFTKFIGGYTRNTVQSITQTYRNKKAKCEICGSRTKKLQAAHTTGNERVVIISNILKNNIVNNILKIDLHDFENKFVKAHYPIKDNIMILCKECHYKYDHPGFTNIPKIDVLKDDDIDLETTISMEAEIIEDFIMNADMNKNKAIGIAGKSLKDDINSNNSVYSNQNNANNVWWLEPGPSKFKADFYMLLNKPKKSKLLIFKIPIGTVSNPEEVFNQRNDKNASRIVIPVSDLTYVDGKGFDFTPFLIKEFAY